MSVTSITDEEYHLSFGLHSGIPLCCAHAFAYEGVKGGPCAKCAEEGVTHEDVTGDLHYCDGRNLSCVPYLERVQVNLLNHFLRSLKEPQALTTPKRLVKGYEDWKRPEKTWGCHTQVPLIEPLRDALKQEGFRMVHLCWPGPSEYWYIFQQPGAEKALCGICNKKFSLKFPTVGKGIL